MATFLSQEEFSDAYATATRKRRRDSDAEGVITLDIPEYSTAEEFADAWLNVLDSFEEMMETTRQPSKRRI